MTKKSFNCSFLGGLLFGSLLIGTSSSSTADVIIGTDLNSTVGSNTAVNQLYSANRGSNGGGDQSLQFGDVITGTDNDDVLIGGLGIDVLFGGAGNDVLLGGTEDFNPLNRDRAFGGAGDDSFIWAPGDGNDFFDGGDGIDVVLFGVVGESTAPDGNTVNPPFFAVNPPGTQGSGDFDGIHLVGGEPVLNIAGGPGFCEIVEKDANNTTALDSLNIDHAIRFVLRGPRSNFDAAVQANPNIDTDTLDTGLRIAVQLRNVEFLVCAGQTANTLQVFDLTQVPAQISSTNALPLRAAALTAQP